MPTATREPLLPLAPRTRPLRAATPLLDAVAGQVGRGAVAFSSPGHKGGAGAGGALRDLLGDGPFTGDVRLDEVTYGTARAEAERRMAALWGAERAFLLVNGSTSGIHALMLGSLEPEQAVVCGRDVHVATHTGLVMTGARPVWITPDAHPTWGVGTGVTPETLAAVLDAHPQVRLALVVSPSAAGVCSDLPRLAGVAHRRGVALAVDETWGPHLRFGALAGLPVDALTAGADAVVTSPHTVLAGLTQGSVLLVRGDRLPLDRVAAAVAMTQTTCPYLPLLASVDACRAQLEDDGSALVSWAADLAGLARTLLGRVPGLRILQGSDLAFDAGSYAGLDPCKLVVDVRGRGVDGREAERALRETHRICPEDSDADRVYLVIGPGDSVASVRRLVLALAAVGSPVRPGPPRHPPTPTTPEQVLSPRQAYFADQERRPLHQCLGRVAAELITAHPCADPVLVPGELVTVGLLDWLSATRAAGGRCYGLDDHTMATLRVVR